MHINFLMNKKSNSGLCIAAIFASIFISDFAEAAPAIKWKVDNKDIFYDKSIYSLNLPTRKKQNDGTVVWPEIPFQIGDAIGDTKDFGISGDSWVSEDFRSLGNFGSSGYFSNPCNTLSVVAVPEPEIYVMLLAGLGMIGFMSHRRKNSSK